MEARLCSTAARMRIKRLPHSGGLQAKNYLRSRQFPERNAGISDRIFHMKFGP